MGAPNQLESEEILDLVDDNDVVIGQIKRAETNTLIPGNGRYVRASDIFIINSDGLVWVPVRSTHKILAPGGLDFSVGGHVASGESYETTAIRELQEEAGLDIEASELERIGIIPPDARHFSCLYLLYTDAQPTLSDEHTSGSWMTIDNLQKAIEQGTPAKDSLLPKLELLKAYLSNK